MEGKWVMHLGSGELQPKTNVHHEDLESEEPRKESLKSRESTQPWSALIIYQHQERKSQTAKERPAPLPPSALLISQPLPPLDQAQHKLYA